MGYPNLKHCIMKKLIAICLILFCSPPLYGQLISKGNQEMLEQIAALQVYIGHVQKGYRVAREGLNLISDIRKGDLKLHSDYFSSLKSINPRIRSGPQVVRIMALQKQILQGYLLVYKEIKQSGAFRDGELKYYLAVLDKLLQESDRSISTLTIILSAGQLELTDEERIKRITIICHRLEQQSIFIQAFYGELKVLAALRKKEKKDINNSRLHHGIKN